MLFNFQQTPFCAEGAASVELSIRQQAPTWKKTACAGTQTGVQQGLLCPLGAATCQQNTSSMRWGRKFKTHRDLRTKIQISWQMLTEVVLKKL